MFLACVRCLDLDRDAVPPVDGEKVGVRGHLAHIETNQMPAVLYQSLFDLELA